MGKKNRLNLRAEIHRLRDQYCMGCIFCEEHEIGDRYLHICTHPHTAPNYRTITLFEIPHNHCPAKAENLYKELYGEHLENTKKTEE